ncbi:MAG TPA: type II toxin-antitoxin system RelE/ParE family toxin [Longimicrobium sp.]|nr:type II toxin-antitoxin system RelE/ParE family toxin [Longimicrobium sp.]
MIRATGSQTAARIVSARDRKLPQPRAARNTCPPLVWPVARRKLDMLVQAERLGDLRKPFSNKLHPLKWDRAGQHAIRVNDTYRICFRWTAAGAEDVEITDYHA